MCAVEDCCVHSNENVVIQPAAVNNCTVTDGNIVTYDDRKSFCAVNYTIVLNIGTVSDSDGVCIPSQYGTVPYGDIFSEFNISEYLCAWAYYNRVFFIFHNIAELFFLLIFILYDMILFYQYASIGGDIVI